MSQDVPAALVYIAKRNLGIRHDTLWARIVQNVKKPHLTVNVIDFGSNVCILLSGVQNSPQISV